MKDRKLALRYARALLSSLPAGSDSASVDAFLGALGESLESAPHLRDTLLNPAVPRTARKQVLHDLAKGRSLPSQVGHFLSVILDNGRLGSLPAIAAAFREVREAAAGVVPATLTTAAPLTPELERRTMAALERLTGRKVRLQTRVDPSLVGGAVTQIGSTVYDGSLRTQLTRLRRIMTQE